MSSSSSEDDDDLLTAVPAFKSRTRKSVGAEKKMFKFLDDMMEKEQQRKDLKEKMDEMMQEEMESEEEEESKEEKDKKEEEKEEEKEEKKGGAVVDKDNGQDDGGDKQDDTNRIGHTTATTTTTSSTTAAAAASPSQSSYSSRPRRKRQQTRRYGTTSDKPPSPVHSPPPPPKPPTPPSPQENPKPKPDKKRPKKPKRKYAIKDAAYWSRVEAITQSADSALLLSSSLRQQSILDDIEGVTQMSSASSGSEGEEDGGGGRGGEDGRKRRRAEAEALVTGRSSNLGTRMVFGRWKKGEAEGVGVVPKVFEGWTYPALTVLVNTWDCPSPRVWKQSKEKRERWEEMRVGVVRTLKKALEVGLLVEYLMHRVWCPEKKNGSEGNEEDENDGDSNYEEEEEEKKKAPMVPYPLLVWLIRTVVGLKEGMETNVRLAIAAQRMALHVIRSRMAVVVVPDDDDNDDYTEEDGDDDDKDDGDDEGKIFRLREFIPLLEGGFGLWTGVGFPPPPPSEQDGRSGGGKDASDVSNEKKEEEKKYFAYEFRLKCVLELWSAAFDTDVVYCEGDAGLGSWDVSEDTDGNSGADGNNGDRYLKSLGRTVAQILAVLVRIGIDPSFHSGHGLVSTRNKLIVSLFQWIERNDHHTSPPLHNVTPTPSSDSNTPPSSTHQGDLPTLYQNWILHAANLSLKHCIGFSSGPPGSPDHDDTEGWLPMALAVRTCCQGVGEEKETGCLAFVLFCAIFSSVVSRTCIHGTDTVRQSRLDEWEGLVHEKALALYRPLRLSSSSSSDDPKLEDPKQQAEVPPRYRFLATAETTLHRLVNDENTRDDGPRFLASVEVASHCTNMGTVLFRMTAGIDRSLRKTDKQSIEEANMLLGQHFGRLVDFCSRLKSGIGHVFAFPHLARVQALLSCQTKFYGYCEEVSANNGGGAKGSSGGKRDGSLLKYLVKKEGGKDDHFGMRSGVDSDDGSDSDNHIVDGAGCGSDNTNDDDNGDDDENKECTETDINAGPDVEVEADNQNDNDADNDDDNDKDNDEDM